MTGPPAAPVPFDARPLTERLDRGDVRAYTKALHESGRATNGERASRILLAVAGAFLAGTLLLDLATGSTLVPVVFFLWLLTVAMGITAIGMFIYERRASVRRYRLDRFARVNGMSYVSEVADTRLPGMIFGIGRQSRGLDLVRTEVPRSVEFGNYVYTIGSGKNQKSYRWGYVAVKLEVKLPHIVLDATGNNSLFGSSLPTSYQRHQRLSLEGDFDRFFSLYCPAGYERDALYLFTPDVMARFIDNAAELDVEIVDDWLFLYTKRDVSSTDPATWEWVFGAVGAVLDKLAQWERWRDDRLSTTASWHAAVARMAATWLPFAASPELLRPPPGVAAPGRRLVESFPWLATIGGVALVLLWLAAMWFD